MFIIVFAPFSSIARELMVGRVSLVMTAHRDQRYCLINNEEVYITVTIPL